MQSFYRSFRAVVQRHRLVEAGGSLLTGVSGGVDSMVLAHLLLHLQKDISFDLHVAHVNYGLRGKESDAQEKLVRDFARQHQLPHFITKGAGTTQAQTREFRYHYFAEMAEQHGIPKVAVAHHQDDQVETVLGHLLRGSHLKGLRGMRLRRPLERGVELVRPLLYFSKETLQIYAAQTQISFLDDTSNKEDHYWRNRLRHTLLPALRALRPQAPAKIFRFAEEMGEVADWLMEEASVWIKQFCRKEETLLWIPRPRWVLLPRLLRLEILHGAAHLFLPALKNLQKDHFIRCERIALGSKPEGKYSLPEGIRFRRMRDDLFVEKNFQTD